ncbi:hypothetical protein ECTOK1_P10060 (plasmid) [Escherichia coli]|nr:hypothetical protein ECTOK1_P10060 [Escherichia coli]
MQASKGLCRDKTLNPQCQLEARERASGGV